MEESVGGDCQVELCIGTMSRGSGREVDTFGILVGVGGRKSGGAAKVEKSKSEDGGGRGKEVPCLARQSAASL